jgi:hypothetical protein
MIAYPGASATMRTTGSIVRTDGAASASLEKPAPRKQLRVNLLSRDLNAGCDYTKVATASRTHANRGSSTLAEPHCIFRGIGGPACTVVWGLPSAMAAATQFRFRYSVNRRASWERTSLVKGRAQPLHRICHSDKRYHQKTNHRAQP